MNKIIEQLTEIETGAVQIMDSIAPRKQQLSEEYKKETSSMPDRWKSRPPKRSRN